MLNVGWFIGVAHEFRDRAERAQTPLPLWVSELLGNQVKGARHVAPMPASASRPLTNQMLLCEVAVAIVSKNNERRVG